MDEKEFEEICVECSEYIKSIYSKIVFMPEELTVECKVGDFAHFVVRGNEKDDGVLIGRRGATIDSVRLFVHAFSKSKMEGRPCIVEVRDHMQSKFSPINPQSSFSRRRR